MVQRHDDGVAIIMAQQKGAEKEKGSGSFRRFWSSGVQLLGLCRFFLRTAVRAIFSLLMDYTKFDFVLFNESPCFRSQCRLVAMSRWWVTAMRANQVVSTPRTRKNISKFASAAWISRFKPRRRWVCSAMRTIDLPST